MVEGVIFLAASQVDVSGRFTLAVFIIAYAKAIVSIIISMIPELSVPEVSVDEAFIYGLRGWLVWPPWRYRALWA